MGHRFLRTGFCQQNRQPRPRQSSRDRHAIQTSHPCAGERLKFAQEAADVLDTPAIDKLTAWPRGLRIFDDVSLSEAAAEFNRYGVIRIVLRGKAVEHHAGGVFSVADAASFAQSMASAYGLHMVSREDEIDLSD